VAVALAAPDPAARVGIDVEPITERSTDFERLAFAADERAWLDQVADAGSGRAEWVARLWCAKEAIAKATGYGLLGGPAAVSVVGVDAASGAVSVALGLELAAACPELGRGPFRAWTARRGEYVWAWTLAERTD
jgi:phosphopantetheinyl transferase